MRRWIAQMSLTRQVAALSLGPILVLGVVLGLVLQAQIVRQALSDAGQSAQLVARLGIQPRLTTAELRNGLTPGQVRGLDDQLKARSATRDIARIKIWNAGARVIYSDDHALIGRTLTPSDDLRDALAGDPDAADVVNPQQHSETATEVGLGELVEVYVPIRFTPTGRPAGAFEIYLSYAPIAGTISRDRRMILVLICVGLALLWAVIYRIVARASRTLARQSAENHQLARYDQLSGLANRTMFVESLDAQLRESPRSVTTGLLLLNIDGFKTINDAFGRPVGDALLCAVAARLRDGCQASDVLARVGGDEFAVAITAADVADAERYAWAMLTCLQEPIIVQEVALNVEASIGVALAPGHAATPNELLGCASVALDQARTQDARVLVYAPEQESVNPERLLLLGEVRGALERGEFLLHYQPQTALSDGHVTGVEALVRWRHPVRGLLPPVEFIPMIERTALVEPVTSFVIDESLRQLAVWRGLGLTLGMSVNLSARNLLSPRLAGEIERALARHGVPARDLTVEVTESCAMADPQRAIEVLGAIRALGVSVAIDDFGTGHASIAYLAQLPVNELKIDRSFVAHICESERDEAIIRSTIDLAAHLNLRVVAEGIETESVRDRLAELRCDIAQGYLISRPLDAAMLTPWLSAHPGVDVAELAQAS